MKKEILTRYAELGSYYKLRKINFDKLINVVQFPEEVFAYIDDIRVAFPRKDYETIIQEYTNNKNITGNSL